MPQIAFRCAASQRAVSGQLHNEAAYQQQGDLRFKHHINCLGWILAFPAFFEKVRMCVRTIKRDNSDLGVFLVEEQPIWVDMAFPVALIITW